MLRTLTLTLYQAIYNHFCSALFCYLNEVFKFKFTMLKIWFNVTEDKVPRLMTTYGKS